MSEVKGFINYNKEHRLLLSKDDDGRCGDCAETIHDKAVKAGNRVPREWFDNKLNVGRKTRTPSLRMMAKNSCQSNVKSHQSKTYEHPLY